MNELEMKFVSRENTGPASFQAEGKRAVNCIKMNIFQYEDTSYSHIIAKLIE